jgi:hypothetical protein
MVLPVRIELTTSALPRMRSTTELRQHYFQLHPASRASGAGPMAASSPHVKAACGRRCKLLMGWPWQMVRTNGKSVWRRRCGTICAAARRSRANRGMGTRLYRRRVRRADNGHSHSKQSVSSGPLAQGFHAPDLIPHETSDLLHSAWRRSMLFHGPQRPGPPA